MNRKRLMGILYNFQQAAYLRTGLLPLQHQAGKRMVKGGHHTLHRDRNPNTTTQYQPYDNERNTTALLFELLDLSSHLFRMRSKPHYLLIHQREVMQLFQQRPRLFVRLVGQLGMVQAPCPLQHPLTLAFTPIKQVLQVIQHPTPPLFIVPAICYNDDNGPDGEAIPEMRMLSVKVSLFLCCLILLLSAFPLSGQQKPASDARKFWSFQPVARPSLPTVKNPVWCSTPIDPFILAKLEANKLSPVKPADRRTLIRRASYDLTGLPPSPAEVEAFVNNPSPDAFTKVVDRLLASPRYGEQWGRHWLDIVRYADTAGENTDHPLPQAWRYRNWVIQAFNSNKPYDEFLREQIAGDLLAVSGPQEKYADRVIATGYLAIARRFGHDIDQDMPLTYEDTIDNLGKTVLGLSISCARCHDHKFDPITAKDYYGLYGIFESTKFSFPGCEPKQMPRDLVSLLPPRPDPALLDPAQQQADRLDVEIKRLSASAAVRARTLKAECAKGAMLLSAGQIDDGGSKEIVSGAQSPLAHIKVRRGDVILLSITPLKSHGADTTLVDFALQENEGKRRRWNAQDLLQAVPAGNPCADPRTNEQTWCFLDAQDGYRYMTDKREAIEGHPELQGWSNGDTPALLVNTSTQPVKVWTTLPPRSLFLHPGPAGPVALAWLSPIDGEIALSGRITDAHPGGPDGVGWTVEHLSQCADRLLQENAQSAALQKLQQQRAELAPRLIPQVAYAVSEGKPADTHLQKRGDPAVLGDVVPRKFLDILGGQTLTVPQSSGRLELAGWLTSPKNPLTARVIVNRVWQWHFGKGLVATPNDFGTRGAPPTHPELLDYLASEFVRSGWDLKALHRLIMRSSVYQTASAPVSPQALDLYAACSRRKLSAEELRDSLLTVSGDLDPEPGQAHPFPPETTWSFSQHAPFAAEYPTRKRSVYVMQRRNSRSRFLALFDGPDPNASTAVRDKTLVPTQALYFMNDPFFHDCAAKFARQLLGAAATDRERLNVAFRTLYSRPPSEAEQQDAADFFREYRANAGEAEVRNSWNAYARVLLTSNAFFFVD